MAGSLELPSLHVEGDDDLNSIVHLLTRHGIPFEPALRRVEVKNQGSDQRVLDIMPIAVRASTNRSVGFVLDADVHIADRWKQVAGRLVPLGLNLPPVPPADGFIGDLPSLNVRAGVWLMPDNTLDFGRLEDLLRTLVPAGDAIIAHAETATDAACALGALFTPNDRIKAVLHSWLAWQKDPGKPYGTAIKAKFFGIDSEAALRFVAWFRRLYGL